MFKNNKYNFTAFLLWSAYFCHGIQALLLSQNANYFAVKWHLISQADLTNPAKATAVAAATAIVMEAVAWTGWGKLSFLAFSGPLSDKIGRKPLIVLGLLGYVLMFVSFLFATNITVVKFLAFVGGAMTSFYDGAINPALFEMYPDNKSTASVLGKTFISVSSILYPLAVAFIATNGLFSDLVIWIPLVLSAVVFVGVLFAKFPDLDLQKKEGLSASEAIKELEKRQNVVGTGTIERANHGNFALDGTILSVFALMIYSNFYLFQQASKIYATNVLDMSESAAAMVTSLYQLGGLVATFAFAFMMARGVRDMAILAVSPIFAGLAGILVYLAPSPMTLTIAGIIVGFCAAGGLLQMGNGVLNQFFDTNKGRNTSIYYFVMALGAIIIPKAAASLLATGKGELIMLIVAGTGFVAAALMFFAGTRYSHIFGVSIFSNAKNKVQD